MTEVLETKSRYLADFARLEKALPGAKLTWLQRLRKEAIGRFEESGFPAETEETWRFTDITPIVETPFAPAEPRKAEVVPGVTDGPLKAHQIVFVNGRFAPELSSLKSLRSGVQVASLAASVATVEPHLAGLADSKLHPLVALNTALWSDGALVRIGKGIAVEEPIHLLFLAAGEGDPVAIHPRVLIVAEPGSNATIVESYVGTGGVYFTNAVTEVLVGENAVVDYHRLQRESREAYHMATLHVRLERASRFASHAISLGGAIARNEITAVLDGEGAECVLNGLYEATGRQVIDNQTMIDHAKPHGTSRELYKGILDGQARGVFNGRIMVRPNAQKTDAIQINKNLLLSDTALVHTKPQLEILANDVKCKHGATVGQLDRDVLFYLRSRGIGVEAARRLLIHAFTSEIVDQVKIDSIRAQLGGCLTTMIPAEARREYDV